MNEKEKDDMEKQIKEFMDSELEDPNLEKALLKANQYSGALIEMQEIVK